MNFHEPDTVAKIVSFVAIKVEESTQGHVEEKKKRSTLIDTIEGVLCLDPTLQDLRFLSGHTFWKKCPIYSRIKVYRQTNYLGVVYGIYGTVKCFFDQTESKAECRVSIKRNGAAPPFPREGVVTPGMPWVNDCQFGWNKHVTCLRTPEEVLAVIIEEITRFAR